MGTSVQVRQTKLQVPLAPGKVLLEEAKAVDVLNKCDLALVCRLECENQLHLESLCNCKSQQIMQRLQ